MNRNRKTKKVLGKG